MSQKQNITKGVFTMIPVELFQADISAYAFKVACYILHQAENYNPGIRQIAKCTGMHKTVVQRAIANLIAANVLEVTKGDKGKRDVYSFIGQSEWALRAPSSVLQNSPLAGSPMGHNKINTRSKQEEKTKKPKTAEEPSSFTKPRTSNDHLSIPTKVSSPNELLNDFKQSLAGRKPSAGQTRSWVSSLPQDTVIDPTAFGNVFFPLHDPMAKRIGKDKWAKWRDDCLEALTRTPFSQHDTTNWEDPRNWNEALQQELNEIWSTL